MVSLLSVQCSFDSIMTQVMKEEAQIFVSEIPLQIMYLICNKWKLLNCMKVECLLTSCGRWRGVDVSEMAALLGMLVMFVCVCTLVYSPALTYMSVCVMYMYTHAHISLYIHAHMHTHNTYTVVQQTYFVHH